MAPDHPSHPLAHHRKEVRRRWRSRLRDGWILRIGVAVAAAVTFLGPGSSAPAMPPGLFPLMDRLCITCAIRYDLDIAGCVGPNADDLDPSRPRVREWAHAQLRNCLRGCWSEEWQPDIVYELWNEGVITSADVAAIILDLDFEDEGDWDSLYLPITRSRRVFAGSAG